MTTKPVSTQKFSTFHDAEAEKLKAWHAPYADLLAAFSPVCDVGCGPGYFLELLRERGSEGFGIDIDPAMVELAVERGNTALLGDEDSLGKYGAELGGVHVSHVVEHLWGEGVVKLLGNAARALKPGGVLVIRTPNWGNPAVRQFLFWMDHTHTRPYPPELLARMVVDLGLETVCYGFEPTGMKDTYFVARKSDGTAAAGLLAPLQWEIKPVGLGIRIRRRIRRWLEA